MSNYEKHRHRDARLPFILHDYTFPGGATACRGNWHENVELLFCAEGSAIVTSNEQRVRICEGDLAIINANCIHTMQSVEPLRYFVIIVDRAFCVANCFDTNAVTFAPFVRDAEIAALIRALVAEYGSLREAPYGIPEIRARILTVMSLLLRRYATAEESEHRESVLLASIKRVLGYIHSEYVHPLTLDGLAEVGGLSKYYLAREFHRVTGKTVIAYINEVRCDRAKQLLAEGKMTVEGVAYACGFSSASYFARVFLATEGRRPRDYQKEIFNNV